MLAVQEKHCFMQIVCRKGMTPTISILIFESVISIQILQCDPNRGIFISFSKILCQLIVCYEVKLFWWCHKFYFTGVRIQYCKYLKFPIPLVQKALRFSVFERASENVKRENKFEILCLVLKYICVFFLTSTLVLF